MAVGMTEGGLTVNTSADARKRRVNHQSGHVEAKYKLWPHLQARILPRSGPEGHCRYLKLGYPELQYEHAVPT
jgi:hypothetical protein